MRDLPTMAIDTLYHIVKKNNPTEVVDLTLEDFVKKVFEMEKVHGFGKIVASTSEGSEVYFLSSVQSLMITTIFSASTRMRLIQTLIELGGVGIDNVIKAKVHRQRHKYKEYRSLEALYQPLVNLINPSFDLESTEYTCFLATRMVNKLCGTTHSCNEVKDRLRKKGYIDNMGRPLVKGIRSVFNYIELSKPMDIPNLGKEVKTIRTSNLVFDKLTTGFLMNLFRE